MSQASGLSSELALWPGLYPGPFSPSAKKTNSLPPESLNVLLPNDTNLLALSFWPCRALNNLELCFPQGGVVKGQEE